MSAFTYTPAQASAVADVPLKTVLRLIDSRLLRPGRKRVGGRVQRLLSEEQVVYLRLEAEGVRLLPMTVRRSLVKVLAQTPDVDSVTLSEGSAVVIQVKAARKSVMRQLKRLRKAQAMAESRSDIMRGTPVFKGTRIPVEQAADLLKLGMTPEQIAADWPQLRAEHVALAPLYLRAFPNQGRPPLKAEDFARLVRRVTYPLAAIS